MKTNHRIVLQRILTAFLLSFVIAIHVAFAVPPNAAGAPASKMNVSDRIEVEKSLAKELQESVDRKKKLPGQRKINISTILSVKERRLVIDLGRDGVPSKAGAAEEEQCGSLITEAMSIINGIISVNEYSCTYGGRDIYYYHPEPALTQDQIGDPVAAQDDSPVTVMVSGGHGYFFNPVSQEWETRRPLMNGIQEDFITPYFARDVSADIVNKAKLNIAKPRSNGTTVHVASGYPWWKMSARTWLESQLPNNPEIWNSLANDTDPNGQEDDDIRARPLFARYVNATYSLHIHTNGADNTAIRGTIGFYQTGRALDAGYTARILCAMKETIQAKPAYADWSVDLAPRGANKGENRLTPVDRRSTIIEVGFHSNAEDALALQSSEFRGAAVAGMAKGVRLYNEGKSCSTFKIDSIPTVTGQVNTPFNYVINYSGNPTYPVKVYSEPVICANSWSCSRFNRSVISPELSPITQTISCTSNQAGQSGTFRYKRWLVDADGVKTAPVEHTYTCNAAS